MSEKWMKMIPVRIDVLAQVPPTEDIVHLERCWRLDPADPLHGLLIWNPEDAAERTVREYLLNFAKKVILAERRRVAALASTPTTTPKTTPTTPKRRTR